MTFDSWASPDGCERRCCAQPCRSQRKHPGTPRTQDGTVAAGWVNNLDLGRNWQFSKAFEDKIAALTPEQVNAAFRKYIDPAAMTFVVAGDGKKGAK